MRTLKTALAAMVGMLALTSVAHALEAGPVSLAFNIGANTDYTFRGVSQTDEEPSVFGGADAATGIAYAGVWASSIDFNDSTDAEIDLYAGVKPTAGPITFDMGVIYYGYLDQPPGADYDYWEGKLAASIPAGPATVGAAMFYSPNFFGAVDDAWYYEANFSATIPQTRFNVSGALGRQHLGGGGDYTTWNLGLGYAMSDHFGLDVRYQDTDGHEFGKLFDSRIVGGIKFTW